MRVFTDTFMRVFPDTFVRLYAYHINSYHIHEKIILFDTYVCMC